MSDATDRHDQIASAAGRTHQLCLSKWKKYIKRECIRRGYRLWLPKTDGTKLGFSSQSEGPLSHSCTVQFLWRQVLDAESQEPELHGTNTDRMTSLVATGISFLKYHEACVDAVEDVIPGTRERLRTTPGPCRRSRPSPPSRVRTASTPAACLSAR